MIPKIIERESGLPEDMTQEQLDRILRPNLLALARIIAMDIKKDMDGGGGGNDEPETLQTEAPKSSKTERG